MNKYIEHIIKDLVRDTRIDYDQERIPNIHFPFFLSLRLVYFHHLPLTHSLLLPSLHPNSFSKYCKEKYGLTEDEIDYVWDQYKSIIKDKISKRES